MSEILNYNFPKPAMLDRDDAAKRKAAELRERGCLTGVLCCLNCFTLSNWFWSGDWKTLTAKDWSSAQCPACGEFRGIFLHDNECLDSNQTINPKDTQ